MFILPAESSKGAPYWGDGHGGAYGSGIGVPDDEVAYGLSQHPPQRTIGGDGAAVGMRALITRTTTRTHPLGQLADDVGDERGATVLHAHDAWPAIPVRQGGTVGVDASGSTLVHRNAGGGTSVHVCVSPGGEVCVAVEFVTHATTRGGPIQPLLQSSDPMGPPGRRAPQSSQDGVAVEHWPLTVTDTFLTGDGETPYLGGGALAVADVFSARDGETFRRGACIPFLRDGGGANARGQHVIDIPPPLLAANRAEEESTDATTGTTDRARKLLEKLLFTLLPACVIALGPLSGAPDYAKLANYIIMGVLIVLLVIGMSSRACAKHVVRLATCAGIFAMTVFVSTQFSRRIYIAIAALVGVALSGITLAV